MNWTTHSVFNQPRPLSNSNLFLSDTPLREAVAREGAQWDAERLASVGQQLGSSESLESGRLANAFSPELLRYDARGERLDEVRFHPAWHLLMHGLCANRLHNLPWQTDPPAAAMVARAARFILHAQVEAGTLCPLTMTFGAIPLLRQHLPTLFSDWLTPLLSDRYDPHQQPAEQKRGLLIGMGMTEKQGGTDVLSNTTRAEPLTTCGPGEAYRLTGHKWFFSVPQSDAHLVLAQTQQGISCFFLPRLLPDGTRNAIIIERLKDKLGNRANASAEVEFREAIGWLIGEEGDGVRHIMQMGSFTRVDCALGSHGQMRRALSVALFHAHQRQVMGKNLVDQPLMRQVLGRQALQLEAQTALLMQLAHRFDASSTAWCRLFTPVVKFAICKAGIPFVAEAMEVLGGIGYCEESELPRLYREMPVNSIWEGSGNVMCLDVLRVLRKQPALQEMLDAEFAELKGVNRHFDRRWRQLQRRLPRLQESDAREVTGDLYALAATAQVLRVGSPPLADAYAQMSLDARGQKSLPPALVDRLLLRACGG